MLGETKLVRDTADEALRILRRIDVVFADNSQRHGSGFVGRERNTVITCAHVVQEPGTTLKTVLVDGRPAKLRRVESALDIAELECDDDSMSETTTSGELAIGDQVVFSGFPAGVRKASVFAGILSAHGEGLIEYPRCRLFQVNGMINSGNSGGPLMKAGTTKVAGVVTAKYVPLLKEIDELNAVLRRIPQMPSAVALQGVDFGKFVNLTIEALRRVSGSLKLVQVGVGYAVPLELYYRN